MKSDQTLIFTQVIFRFFQSFPRLFHSIPVRYFIAKQMAYTHFFKSARNYIE